MNSHEKIAKETDQQIAKELIKNGYVAHRINTTTKIKQVKITVKGKVSLKLLKRLQRKEK